ncbi:hypothetical protein E2562_027021 [Oryza meyeriana var. granulata]|uniref:Uncharacterized protein n=1 Tax=Oryza meyeriana var. granulata TaxID=110450 RepID=A0A6G1C988_9ORYZ|nr:hypothetical protein E2562_027021 [Oryza meyeriana var. granulata]
MGAVTSPLHGLPLPTYGRSSASPDSLSAPTPIYSSPPSMGPHLLPPTEGLASGTVVPSLPPIYSAGLLLPPSPRWAPHLRLPLHRPAPSRSRVVPPLSICAVSTAPSAWDCQHRHQLHPELLHVARRLCRWPPHLLRPSPPPPSGLLPRASPNSAPDSVVISWMDAGVC